MKINILKRVSGIGIFLTILSSVMAMLSGKPRNHFPDSGTLTERGTVDFGIVFTCKATDGMIADECSLTIGSSAISTAEIEMDNSLNEDGYQTDRNTTTSPL